MLLPFLILLIPCLAWSEVKTEFNGNVEVQSRHSWNNPEAKAAPLNQDWKEENFSQVFGNIGGKVELNNSRIEANWFGRAAYSPLYQNDYLATQIYTFPNKLVARDVFKLQYRRVDGDHQTDSTINKLFYEMDFDDNRFVFGRMFINYGLGEVFNPMNPFNQPTGLTSVNNFSQGNDGFRFTMFLNDYHTINFFLLGDKSVEGYEGQIDRTLWVHGEYQVNDKLTLDYVIGEDQNRQKVGGQSSYQFEKAMVFGQLLYQTELVNDEPSNNLWDVLLGYDQQVTNLYHIRVESGYQKKNLFPNLAFSDRFLPSEYFVSLANIYDIHPLVKLNGTLINDIKTGFTYFVGKSTWSMSHNIESEIFMYAPVGKGSSPDQLAQRLITTDIGLALRAFF